MTFITLINIRVIHYFSRTDATRVVAQNGEELCVLLTHPKSVVMIWKQNNLIHFF